MLVVGLKFIYESHKPVYFFKHKVVLYKRTGIKSSLFIIIFIPNYWRVWGRGVSEIAQLVIGAVQSPNFK